MVPKSRPPTCTCAAGGTTFAFIEYDDDRDAEDAVRDRDGYKFDGQRLRVELARGGRRGGPDDSGRGFAGGHGPPQRTDYKVLFSCSRPLSITLSSLSGSLPLPLFRCVSYFSLPL
jgi:hypothetical protein